MAAQSAPYQGTLLSINDKVEEEEYTLSLYAPSPQLAALRFADIVADSFITKLERRVKIAPSTAAKVHIFYVEYFYYFTADQVELKYTIRIEDVRDVATKRLGTRRVLEQLHPTQPRKE